MTETIQQLKEDIAILQEKLRKLEEQDPEMLLLRQGKVDFVDYDGKKYIRIEYTDSFADEYNWCVRRVGEDAIRPVRDVNVYASLEELYQKEVVKQKDDYPYKIVDEHGETNPYKQYLNSVEDEKKMEELGFVKNSDGNWTAQSLAQEEVKKLQEKDWEIKVETDYRTGKARHKTRIVDKDGNDYKPEPLTTEELLKPKWEPKSQSEEEVADGLKEAFVKAQQTEKWKEIQKLIDEEDNDKNFKNSLDLIKEWGEKNKPKSLYQICMEWWDEVFVNEMDNDICIDVLVSKIDKEFIPPIHDANDYHWNKCLKMMRDKLRDT